jgi:hypothetical protein
MVPKCVSKIFHCSTPNYSLLSIPTSHTSYWFGCGCEFILTLQSFWISYVALVLIDASNWQHPILLDQILDYARYQQHENMLNKNVTWSYVLWKKLKIFFNISNEFSTTNMLFLCRPLYFFSKINYSTLCIWEHQLIKQGISKKTPFCEPLWKLKNDPYYVWLYKLFFCKTQLSLTNPRSPM